MTNSNYKEKYPIGTKIRWVLNKTFANDLAKKDIGKVGKIVGYNKQNQPSIFLPESIHLASNSTQAVPISWWSSWEDIEILYQKNNQLLFSFMED